MSSVVIFGGYGTFGAHVATELAQRGVQVAIAGRDLGRAQAFAATLGAGHGALAADVTQPASCREALRGCEIAVNCAGPFGVLGTALLDACVDLRCHYADIADDRGYGALVRSYQERFQQCGRCAVYGCSSLPGISGALALLARGSGAAPQRARVTLFIGNDNPKGSAAIRSLLGLFGKAIPAPQGQLWGFRDREVVPLPEPFGRRAGFNFESPEYDLFPALLGVEAVRVKVGFELRSANYGLALLAVPGWRIGAGTATLLERFGGLFRRLGCSGGAVMTELFFRDGSTRRAALVARREGQRMAALPCALAVKALLDGKGAAGVRTVYDLLGAGPLLEDLTAAGFELHHHEGTADLSGSFFSSARK